MNLQDHYDQFAMADLGGGAGDDTTPSGHSTVYPTLPSPGSSTLYPALPPSQPSALYPTLPPSRPSTAYPTLSAAPSMHDIYNNDADPFAFPNDVPAAPAMQKTRNVRKETTATTPSRPSTRSRHAAPSMDEVAGPSRQLSRAEQVDVDRGRNIYVQKMIDKAGSIKTGLEKFTKGLFDKPKETSDSEESMPTGASSDGESSSDHRMDAISNEEQAQMDKITAVNLKNRILQYKSNAPRAAVMSNTLSPRDDWLLTVTALNPWERSRPGKYQTHSTRHLSNLFQSSLSHSNYSFQRHHSIKRSKASLDFRCQNTWTLR